MLCEITQAEKDLILTPSLSIISFWWLWVRVYVSFHLGVYKFWIRSQEQGWLQGHVTCASTQLVLVKTHRFSKLWTDLLISINITQLQFHLYNGRVGLYCTAFDITLVARRFNSRSNPHFSLVPLTPYYIYPTYFMNLQATFLALKTTEFTTPRLNNL